MVTGICWVDEEPNLGILEFSKLESAGDCGKGHFGPRIAIQGVMYLAAVGQNLNF